MKNDTVILLYRTDTLTENMKIQILVATHKEYRMPSDPLYLPVQAGAALRPALPYVGDSSGENISDRNPNFCELTCLYWGWKNLDADVLGLCHYRRYFAGHKNWKAVLHTGRPDPWACILTLSEAEELLKTVPVLLPKKRNYYIETGYSQYAHAHHEEDLIVTRTILAERFPDYVEAFDRTLARPAGHRFNMFVMRRDLLDRYCSWLFEVLFELEKRLDFSDYSDYDKRVFGFVSERLLDVWIETNEIQYRELPVLHMESQHWLKKGTAFLRRKFLHTK